VSRFFDDRARDWEAPYRGGTGYQRRFFVSRMEQVMRLAGPVDGRRVLDVGAASGDYVRALAARGAAVAAVDLSPGMVRRARARSREEVWPGVLGFGVAEGARLPFAGARFDLALCIGVIDYVPEPAPLLQSLARVLRPGGALIITSPNPDALAVRTELLVNRIANAVRRRTPLSLRRYTPADLDRHITASGFRLDASAASGFLPYNLALRVPGSSAVDRFLARWLSRGSRGRRFGATYIVRAIRG
jgi:SAM-dependent methyltransferase